MNDYNSKTEELIKMYLSFSANKNINIDEFVKLRKQAMKEIDKENGKYRNNVIHPLGEKRKNKKEDNINVITQENLTSKQIKPKEEFKPTEAIEFNAEKMFLQMVKEIQD